MGFVRSASGKGCLAFSSPAGMVEAQKAVAGLLSLAVVMSLNKLAGWP